MLISSFLWPHSEKASVFTLPRENCDQSSRPWMNLGNMSEGHKLKSCLHQGVRFIFPCQDVGRVRFTGNVTPCSPSPLELCNHLKKFTSLISEQSHKDTIKLVGKCILMGRTPGASSHLPPPCSAFCKTVRECLTPTLVVVTIHLTQLWARTRNSSVFPKDWVRVTLLRAHSWKRSQTVYYMFYHFMHFQPFPFNGLVKCF